MFLQLIDDIKFCILSNLDIRSLLNLSATCHRLKALVGEKTVWLDALDSMRSRRAVPLAHWEQASRSASATVPLERLRSAIIRAAKLEHNWSKDIIRPTRFERQQFVEKQRADSLLWVWNLGFCDTLLVYTMFGWFTVFNTAGQSVTFRTASTASCFDFDVDSEGITLIFNVADGGEEISMELHRVEFQEWEYRFIKDIPTRGHVHSNFLEDELAGCVLSSGGPTGTYEILIANWFTEKFTRIDTGIEVRRHLTVSTTKDRIFLGHETIGLMITWWYTLDSLRWCIAQAESPEAPYVTMLAPQESRHIHYIDQGLHSRLGPSGFYPTSRGMWTGRQSFFTVYLASGGASFTYALIPEEPPGLGLRPEADGSNSDQAQASLEADDAMKLKIVSRKSFVYHVPDNTVLSSGLGVHYLQDFGYQGKNAVWVEEFVGGGETCRLATFNHEDDSIDVPVSGATSTIVFEEEEFSWKDIRKIQLDDQSGVLTCFTDVDIWRLYFD